MLKQKTVNRIWIPAIDLEAQEIHTVYIFSIVLKHFLKEEKSFLLKQVVICLKFCENEIIILNSSSF